MQQERNSLIQGCCLGRFSRCAQRVDSLLRSPLCTFFAGLATDRAPCLTDDCKKHPHLPCFSLHLCKVLLHLFLHCFSALGLHLLQKSLQMRFLFSSRHLFHFFLKSRHIVESLFSFLLLRFPILYLLSTTERSTPWTICISKFIP